MRIEGRPYTTIERNLVERMVSVVLSDLSAAFDPLSPVTFRFDRLETNPRFATIARPANAAVLARLRIDMEDRGGRLELMLPYATLEPVRELLLQMFMGEKFGRDSIWETHLANELWNTDVELEAVLDEIVMPLHDVLKLKPGSRILLNAMPTSTIDIGSSGVSLAETSIAARWSIMFPGAMSPLSNNVRSVTVAISVRRDRLGSVLCRSSTKITVGLSGSSSKTAGTVGGPCTTIATGATILHPHTSAVSDSIAPIISILQRKGILSAAAVQYRI